MLAHYAAFRNDKAILRALKDKLVIYVTVHLLKRVLIALGL